MTVLNRIEIHAADHCVLKCNHCSHAADIAPKAFYGPEHFERWFSAIACRGITWSEIAILGGEPFMNKSLDKLAQMANRYGDRVVIMTNGFWMKSKQAVLDKAAVLNEIETLVVTLYDPLLDKCGGLEAVESRMTLIKKQFGVNVVQFVPGAISHFCEINFHKSPLPVVNEHCNFRSCPQLLHTGHLLGCCASRRVIDWPEAQIDRFDLNCDDWPSESLIDWYNRPMLQLCSHCSIATSGEKPIPWSTK